MTIPSYRLTTGFEQQMFQLEANRQLVHTYTRQSRVPLPQSADNDWGQPDYTFPPPIPNQPCFFQTNSEALVQNYGLLSRNMFVLWVSATDPLERGDWVTNIQTLPDSAHGIPAVLLLSGPVEVIDINQQSPNVGGEILVEATLRNMEIIPTDRPGGTDR